MRKIAAVIGFGLYISLCQVATGTTWYVDGSAAETGDGTQERPFETIQEGIDAATHDDTVIVAQGKYVENIHFDGKNIVLRSTDPLNPDVVANTIIDGNEAGSVVTFSGTENETCLLAGFTIRNGRTRDGGGICGGTRESPSHATIENNSITGNAAGRAGGGLADCGGPIQNNTISGNSADFGGGLWRCRGTIQNNAIGGNFATGYFGWGGGLYECNGTIQNNRVSDNCADVYGGGLCICGGTI